VYSVVMLAHHERARKKRELN